jgi:hypothetical protein
MSENATAARGAILAAAIRSDAAHEVQSCASIFYNGIAAVV